MMSDFIVYIIANEPYGTIYIGVTNDLKRRITEHKLGVADGFTKKYSLKLLVYFERFEYIEDAIAREKKLKHWNREWKVDLINKFNSSWRDLFYDMFVVDKEYEAWIKERSIDFAIGKN